MNTHYNIAFCGLGSIGRRHIRNVAAALAARGASCTIDLYRATGLNPVPDDIAPLIRAVYPLDRPLHEDIVYDAVFVTNPTSAHLQTVMHFIDNTRSFFIEKPIFDHTDIDPDLLHKLDSIPSYVACPLRYNPVLQYVKQTIDCGPALAVRAISSSYLPDWRPGQDYRQCYSAHRHLGGGVDIDLIHEWDYLTWLFGMPDICYSIVDNVSDLEIDSNDVAIYIARNKKMTFELHLDYYGRQPLRSCEIFLPDDTIHCDILNGRIDFLKADRSLLFDSQRNAYQLAEINHFIDIIDDMTPNDSTPMHALQVLKLAKGLL